jgi:mono/diheme cytochrome c family protein
MLKPLFLLCALVLGSSFQAAIAPSAQTAVAPALPAIPAEAIAMVNPVKPTPEGVTHAKKMYGWDCAVCHGEKGDGKGELSATMKLKDWTDAASLKDMTDGELFYIIKNGRGQMTGEGDRAKTADLWNLVVVTRSFAKK